MGLHATLCQDGNEEGRLCLIRAVDSLHDAACLLLRGTAPLELENVPQQIGRVLERPHSDKKIGCFLESLPRSVCFAFAPYRLSGAPAPKLKGVVLPDTETASSRLFPGTPPEAEPNAKAGDGDSLAEGHQTRKQEVKTFWQKAKQELKMCPTQTGRTSAESGHLGKAMGEQWSGGRVRNE